MTDGHPFCTTRGMAIRYTLPDLETLRDTFDCDPDAGILRWKEKPGNVQWNRTFAGKVAGGVDGKGYIRIRQGGRYYNAHRLIWKMVHGVEPEWVDHINGDRSDNRISNLRSVGYTENSRNRGVFKNNSSGVTGVHWVVRERKWRACISDNGLKVSLGDYDSFSDAVDARLKAEEKFGYHANHGRTAPCQ